MDYEVIGKVINEALALAGQIAFSKEKTDKLKGEILYAEDLLTKLKILQAGIITCEEALRNDKAEVSKIGTESNLIAKLEGLERESNQVRSSIPDKQAELDKKVSELAEQGVALPFGTQPQGRNISL